MPDFLVRKLSAEPTRRVSREPADAFRPQAAMVLAAGLGERMRPLTLDKPKPLLAVGGRTLLDWSLDRFAAHGTSRVVVNLHYKAEMLERHLADRQDLNIVLSHEPERLETGGGIVRALPHLRDGPFYVANSDSIWLDGPTSALSRLAARWDDTVMDALLLLMTVPRSNHYDGMGDFMMDPMGGLTFRPERRVVPYVYAGLHIASPRLFAGAPDGPFGLTKLWRKSADEGRLFGIIHDGAWFHVGTPDALSAADAQLDSRHARWLEP